MHDMIVNEAPGSETGLVCATVPWTDSPELGACPKTGPFFHSVADIRILLGRLERSVPGGRKSCLLSSLICSKTEGV